MEELQIVDMQKMIKITKICIDQFVSASETASVLLKPKQHASNRDRVTTILAGIYGKRYASEEASKSALNEDLKALVSEVLLGVASESLREERIDAWSNRNVTSISRDQQAAVKLIRSFKTFDKQMKAFLSSKEQTLESIINEHSRIVTEIQNLKEKYWAYDKKCQRFPSMLQVAMLEHNPLTDLTKREIKAGERVIKEIRTSFVFNLRRASDLWHKLEKLQAKEKILRGEMERECRAYRDAVDRQISDRIDLGLKGLRCAVDNVVRDTFWHAKLHQKVEEIDTKSIVSTILGSCTWTYSFPENMSCVNEHGVEADIPDPIKKKSFSALPNKETSEEQTGYVELLSDVTSDTAAFLKGQKGSKIKRKISVEGSPIEFGWTRKFPWSLKTYGFFKKENVSYC